MNNRPPPRRGLGRGLGSLIPSGPLPDERDGVRGEEDPAGPPQTEAERPTERPTERSTERTPERQVGAEPDTSGPAPTRPTALPPPADWIGRIPPPAGAPDRATNGGASAPSATGVDARATDGPAPGSGDGTALRPVAGAHFAELAVSSISPNPRQPRQVFDEDALAELVHSIREVGLLQPVVVRATAGNRFELIMGERRLRASQQAGLETIPAIVRDTGDDAMLRDALLENLHRAQLNPLEEAAAYQQLLDDFGCTHDELATRIGRSRPQISNTLRLLKLSPAVQRRVAAGVLSAGHARTLLGVPDADTQDRLAARVVAEGISVRGLEELVAVGELGEQQEAPRRRAQRSHPELGDLTDHLSDRFDTRVKVDMGRNKGRLTIEFASLEDLHRIVRLMEPEGRGADAEQTDESGWDATAAG